MENPQQQTPRSSPTPTIENPKPQHFSFFSLKSLLILLVVAIFTFAGTYYVANRNTQVACTEDAKLCPDGSYVSRAGPTCDFAPCPTIQISLTPTITYSSSPTPDPTTANWKTYTTNEKMDISDVFFKANPEITSVPQLTFKYPPTWHIIHRTQDSLWSRDRIISLNFEIRKTHPKWNTHQVEGLLPDNATLELWFGKTTPTIKDFDYMYWVNGHVIEKTDKTTINGIPFTRGYYYADNYPIRSIFHLSPITQLHVRALFVNTEASTDSKCISEYCKTTVKEINQILHTFKFLE